jgi:hypothetical protein
MGTKTWGVGASSRSSRSERRNSLPRKTALGSLVTAALAMVALTAATDARADGEFTASGGNGTIEVKGTGHWHINTQGPWKATVNGQTFAKDKWQLTEASAKVSGVPAGEATVKVYVCSGETCKAAEVKVKVN